MPSDFLLEPQLSAALVVAFRRENRIALGSSVPDRRGGTLVGSENGLLDDEVIARHFVRTRLASRRMREGRRARTAVWWRLGRRPFDV